MRIAYFARTSVTLAVFAGVAGMLHPAIAASAGQCFSSQQAFTAALDKEDLHTYGSGTSVSQDGDYGTGMVYANDDGSIGYYLTSDVPTSSPQFLSSSHKLCITNKLNNVTLFDARIAGVPKAAVITNGQCGSSKDCKSHNTALKKQSDNGMNVMVQAIIVESVSSDKAQAPGNIITLTGCVTEEPIYIENERFVHPGVLGYSTPSGSYEHFIVMRDTSYGKYAIKRLGQSR